MAHDTSPATKSYSSFEFWKIHDQLTFRLSNGNVFCKATVVKRTQGWTEMRKENSTCVQLAQKMLHTYSSSLTPFSSQDHSSYLYLVNACVWSCSCSESRGWPLSWRVWWTLTWKWSLSVDCVALSTFLCRGNCGEIGMTGLQLHYSQSCSFSLEAVEPSSLLSVTLIFSV